MLSNVYIYPHVTWSKYSTARVNTLRPRQNGRHLPDDNLKRIFLNGNVWISIKISLKFVPRGPINNIPALVQIMAWRRQGDKPLSGPMIFRLLTHICVTRPQWVKCPQYRLINMPGPSACTFNDLCNDRPLWKFNWPIYRMDMMTSSNGNIFRVTGHLCGEFTGLRWIPHTKASDAQLWCFLWSASE